MKTKLCKDCRWCKCGDDYLCKKHIYKEDLITGKNTIYESCKSVRPKCNDWERGGMIGFFKRLNKKPLTYIITGILLLLVFYLILFQIIHIYL